jgi:hypothetical protein
MAELIRSRLAAFPIIAISEEQLQARGTALGARSFSVQVPHLGVRMSAREIPS